MSNFSRSETQPAEHHWKPDKFDASHDLMIEFSQTLHCVILTSAITSTCVPLPTFGVPALSWYYVCSVSC